VTLDGTASIVTGGGRGIGRTLARALADAGSTVAVLGRSRPGLDDPVSLLEEAGGRAAAWSVDVTEGKRVEEVISQIEDTLGPISLLVNNAGDGGGSGPLWETDPDEWWRVMEVNVRGPYLFSRFVLPRMLERGSGRIINVASNVAIQPVPLASAYSCSKTALLRFTDSLALAVRDSNIQVFAISHGWVWTEMTRGAVEVMKANIPGFEGIPDSETSPPEAAAKLVVQLASGKADELTGRYIHVTQDLDDLVANARTIEAEDLLTLRFSDWNEDDDS
jgi:NAD(P)-dependent dehydrogenase (short-subunit alcohol dehydrogenase family)